MRRFASTLALMAATSTLGVPGAGAAIGPCPATPGHRVFDRFEVNTADSPGAGIELGQLVAFPDGSVVAAGFRFTDDESDSVLMRYRPDGTPDPLFGDAGLTLLPKSIQVHEFTPLLALPDGGVALAGIAGSSGHRSLAIVRVTRTGVLDGGFGNHGIARLPGGLSSGASLAVGASGILVGANYLVGRPPRLSHTVGRLVLLSTHGRERRRFSLRSSIASLREVRGGFQAVVATGRSMRFRVRTSGVVKLRTLGRFLVPSIVPTRRGFWLQRARSDGRIEFDLASATRVRRVVSRHPVPASLRSLSAVASDGDGLVAAADALSETLRPGIVFLKLREAAFDTTYCRVVWPDPFELRINDIPGGIVTDLVTAGTHLVAIGQPTDDFAAVFSIRD